MVNSITDASTSITESETMKEQEQETRTIKVPYYDFDRVQSVKKEFMTNKTKWRDSLSRYKEPGYTDDFVYLKVPNGVFIYDKYPKSRIHLLYLPFNIKYNQVTEFYNDAIDSIKEAHETCRQVAKLLESKYSNGLCQTKILIGYHIKPSQNDLHIHLISDDFVRIRDPSKLSSYTDPTKFISVSRVELELKLYHRIKTRERKPFNPSFFMKLDPIDDLKYPIYTK
jgi:diadenosine tetraphosphate (Ap4A) HIT family hydrolase